MAKEDFRTDFIHWQLLGGHSSRAAHAIKDNCSSHWHTDISSSSSATIFCGRLVLLNCRKVIIGHICKLNFFICGACGQMSERKMPPRLWPLREMLMENPVLPQERDHKLKVPQTPASPTAFTRGIRAPGFNSLHSFQRRTGAKWWLWGRIFQARCSEICDRPRIVLGAPGTGLQRPKSLQNPI